jgi:nucleotide-binding universal stress UspA family protein
MYHTILVPTDGSPFSARALPVAAALARRTGATLHLASVHDPSVFIPFVPGEIAVPVYDAEAVQADKARNREALEAQATLLRDSGLTVQTAMLEGTVVEALAEHADAIGADLTVMTTHGRSGFQRLRLGSVASSYLTRAAAPVYLVRATADDAPLLTEAEALPKGTLLCPLDGSTFAASIIPHARRFAEGLGLTIELLSITAPAAIPMAPFGTEALLADPRDLDLQEEARHEYLARIAASCPPNTRTRVLTDMSVARTILDIAAADGAGAIAMATHGRTGIKRLVLGSVADEVLRSADVPMLVYRPTEGG